jgi:hypothetical protein
MEHGRKRGKRRRRGGAFREAFVLAALLCLVWGSASGLVVSDLQIGNAELDGEILSPNEAGTSLCQLSLGLVAIGMPHAGTSGAVLITAIDANGDPVVSNQFLIDENVVPLTNAGLQPGSLFGASVACMDFDGK